MKSAKRTGQAAPTYLTHPACLGHVWQISLLSDEKRAASVIAADDCVCFTLSRKDFTSTLGNLKEIMAREVGSMLHVMVAVPGGLGGEAPCMT